MPISRSKVPLTLQDVCINKVVDDIDSIWAKSYKEQFFSLGDFSYLLGPFDDIRKKLIIKW